MEPSLYGPSIRFRVSGWEGKCFQRLLARFLATTTTEVCATSRPLSVAFVATEKTEIVDLDNNEVVDRRNFSLHHLEFLLGPIGPAFLRGPSKTVVSLAVSL